jgi:cysteine dioxygenase
LQALFSYLDTLNARPSLEELRHRIADADVDLEDLRPHLNFGERGYVRNLIRAGEHYHLLALCWSSGQRSPIHDHAQSACVFRVISGVATETVFEPSASGQLKATHSREYHTGEVVATQDADIHQVSNLESPGVDLVTLHLYTPPLRRMSTYSIETGARADDWVVFDGHADGCGI